MLPLKQRHFLPGSAVWRGSLHHRDAPRLESACLPTAPSSLRCFDAEKASPLSRSRTLTLGAVRRLRLAALRRDA
jgi:hypothetical protein